MHKSKVEPCTPGSRVGIHCTAEHGDDGGAEIGLVWVHGTCGIEHTLNPSRRTHKPPHQHC